MASIQRHGSRWRVQVYIGGKRESKVLPTKQEASQWAMQREAELTGARLPDRTFADALRRYSNEEAPKRSGGAWEIVRINAMIKWPLASRKLAGLGADDFAGWRDARMATHKPGTAAREMNLMRSVLEVARLEWKWLRVNPMLGVRWPKSPRGRARRVTPKEVEAVVKAFGVEALPSDTATQRTGLMFLLALETAMRSGEMVRLTWPDVHLAARYVHLPETKNGDARDVPLTRRAVEILTALPQGEEPVFRLDDRLRDALWRKTRPEDLASLHFHDSRSEAIWRLSKKLDVLQLARAIGHRDPKSLLIYYNEPASEMAKRLD